MTAQEIAALFTRSDGTYRCARWGRPVAPVAFGLADETLDILRAALKAGFAHAGHPVVDTDPESGSNLMLFFARGWDDLAGVPDLDRLTGQPGLPARLAAEGAASYRIFRFDEAGAIRACFAFFDMSGPLAHAHPGALAEKITMESTLTFAQEIQPDTKKAALIRAAYDPVMPAVANDPSHALRLMARMA